MMTLSPGAYLKALRRSAHLTLNDVADRIATEPRQPEHLRARWLEMIEADIAPLDLGTIAVLSVVYPIDILVIYELERHRCGIAPATTPLCLVCGKTDREKCTAGYVAACVWTAPPAPTGVAV
jgi:transcriptional regulator with XRE-family HTH domain